MLILNKDIWSIIYQNIRVIDFDLNQTFHCCIDKTSNEAYNYELKRRETNLLCMICGSNDLIYHWCFDNDNNNDDDDHDDDDNDDDNDYDDYNRNKKCENELEEETGLYCFSTDVYNTTLKKTKWIICKPCKAYHNICVCGKYRNLYSHCGEFFIGDPTNKIYKNEKPYRKYDDNKSYYIQQYFLNNKIKYFSIKLAEITGSDGGMCHEWICKNSLCIEYNEIVSYTDK